ncbi:MAG: hypothetical protein Q8P90_05690 [bacterium]|nr:hypothetical protein [bacterium]
MISISTEMKRITKHSLSFTLVLSLLWIPFITQANVIPVDGPTWYPQIQVTIDDEPIDNSYVLRLAHPYPSTNAKGVTKIGYERKVMRCDQGLCFIFPYAKYDDEKPKYYVEKLSKQVPESAIEDFVHIDKGFYKKQKNTIEETYDVTEQLQNLDFDKQYLLSVDSLSGFSKVENQNFHDNPLYKEYKDMYQGQLRDSVFSIIGLFLKSFGIPIFVILVIIFGILTYTSKRRADKKNKDKKGSL